MTNGLPPLRLFPAEIEALAKLWSTSAESGDIWTPTGRSWPTNSKPIEVRNASNVRGVAKPGQSIGDRCLRAAHEKIVSDLAWMLGLPVPPVTLWDRGSGYADDARHCAVSAWAFPNAMEWPKVQAKLSVDQLAQAPLYAGAMRVFDTWIAAADRKPDHILVSDDGDPATLKLAYIDYAFALSYEWIGVGGAQRDPRAAFPAGVGVDQRAIETVARAIAALEERSIAEVVNRVSSACFHVDARDTIIKGLVSRQAQLLGWLGL